MQKVCYTQSMAEEVRGNDPLSQQHSGSESFVATQNLCISPYFSAHGPLQDLGGTVMTEK